MGKLDKDLSLQERFAKWDRGELTYSEAEQRLLQLKHGETIGDILSACTVCPINNATCHHYMRLHVYGFHPEKGGKETELWLCSLGIKGDGEKCPLNK